jgi:hypothetical protein
MEKVLRLFEQVAIGVLVLLVGLGGLLVATYIVHIFYAPINIAIMGILLLGFLSSKRLKYLEAERERIKATYMVGDRVTVRRWGRKVECVVTPDWKLIEVK